MGYMTPLFVTFQQRFIKVILWKCPVEENWTTIFYIFSSFV